MEINLCMGCMKEKTQPGPCPHCGFDEAAYEPLPHHLPPETILCGKYLVVKVMGEGGFGITYVGWDLNLVMKVAIKEYFPQGFVSRENSRSNTVTLLTGYQAEFFSSGEVFSALILVALLLSAAFINNRIFLFAVMALLTAPAYLHKKGVILLSYVVPIISYWVMGSRILCVWLVIAGTVGEVIAGKTHWKNYKILALTHVIYNMVVSGFSVTISIWGTIRFNARLQSSYF